MEILLFFAVVGLVFAMVTEDGTKETVILLPDESGHVGKVAINPGANELVLDEAREAALIGQGTRTVVLTEDAIRSAYGDTISARPPAPGSYMLYFRLGTTDLVPNSVPVLEKVRADLAQRPAPEITIIGHTDRVGTVPYNDGLARDRAVQVRAWLGGQGIDPALMDVAGRGEREPIIATADEIPEPRNRRVEISIR